MYHPTRTAQADTAAKLPSPNCQSGIAKGQPHSAPWPFEKCPLCGAKRLTAPQMTALRSLLHE